MCVIVDTNCIPIVFNTKAADHARFAKVYTWITKKQGRIVYGGTKYANELRPMRTYLILFLEYEKAGKVVRLNDSEVDAFAAAAKSAIKSKKFNDEHLVGIVATSGCRVICTDDDKAVPFLTDKTLYKKPRKPPKIYSQAIHGHLCCDNHLIAACRR